MSTAIFTLRQARTVQGMLDEVNLQKPARVAIGGAGKAARELAAAFLGETADPAGAVVVGSKQRPEDVGDAAAFVLMIDEWPLSERAVQQLRAFDRASVPLVAVSLGLREAPRSDEIPYVLATDVVRAESAVAAAGQVMARIAIRAKGDAYRLGPAFPAFREQISKAIISHYARRNALVSAAALVPAADLPVLTLNQLRMVARIAGAHGIELDTKRLLELGLVVGAGLGLRGIVRTALGVLPGPGWAIKSSVALGGTTAIGQAAVRRFQAEVESGTRAADISVDAPRGSGVIDHADA